MNLLVLVETERGIDEVNGHVASYLIDPPWPLTDEGINLWQESGNHDVLIFQAADTMKKVPNWETA